MLSEAQKRYLKTIPEDKVAIVEQFNPQDKRIGEKFVDEVKLTCPNIAVLLMGSTGLGIAGQRDLDVYALSRSDDFPRHLPKLIKMFGQPKHQHNDSVEWKFVRDDREIEFYLSDPGSASTKEQITVFNMLKSDGDLRSEYETIKLVHAGKSQRDYQQAKYEFFNKILKEKF